MGRSSAPRHQPVEGNSVDRHGTMGSGSKSFVDLPVLDRHASLRAVTCTSAKRFLAVRGVEIARNRSVGKVASVDAPETVRLPPIPD